MFKKIVAGVGLGTLAAVLVLGLAASTDLLDRLELTTYDWRMRLAADPAGGQQGHRPHQDRRRQHPRLQAPTFGRVALAARWRCRSGSTSSTAAPAKVVAVDVLFTEQDKVVETYVFDAGTPGEERWSAKQSEGALVDSVKSAGNVDHARRRCLRGTGRRHD